MKTAAMTFHVRALRDCPRGRVRARKLRMRLKIQRMCVRGQIPECAIEDDDPKRRAAYSKRCQSVFHRTLSRLFVAVRGGGALFIPPSYPVELAHTAVLAPNRLTLKLLRQYAREVAAAVTDKNPEITLRLKRSAMLGIQFGQATARSAFYEIAQRGSGGRKRKPETQQNRKLANDRFRMDLTNEFAKYKAGLKKADRAKPIPDLVDGFREYLRALITKLEAQDDPELLAFAKRLRGKAGTDGDGVMGARQLGRHLSKESNTK